MKTEIDKFSQLVEKKLNDFEVPFEPSHWAEMNQKLDQISITSPSNSLLRNKWLWAGVAAMVVAGSWILFSDKSSTINSDLPDNKQGQTIEHSVSESSNQDLPVKNSNEKVIEPKITGEESHDSEVNPTHKKVDNKLEKYKEINEENVKSQSQDFVNEKVDNHKSVMPSAPKIDNPELKTEIVITTSLFCEGDEIEFTVDKKTDNAEYYWNFGDNGLTSRKMNPIHKFRKAGRYTVTLLVSKGEKNDYKAEKEIIVHSKPSVTVEDKKNLITLNHPYAEFEASSAANCEFKWTFNEVNRASGPKVDFLVPDRGAYNVVLSAISENGCTTQENFTYQAIKGVRMNVENTLTPNNDGINDDFLPKELTISDVEFSFVVLDQNGRLVFESKDKFTPWNGSINNSGGPIQQGTYLWKVSFKDDRGKVHKQEGKITLLQ